MNRTRAVWLGIVLLGCGALWIRPAGRAWIGLPEALNAWFVVAMAIWLQALPFLVLGVLVAAGLRAFLPPGSLNRFLPGSPAGAVPAAGLAGMLLPGCECASVPTAKALVGQGVHPAAALTFLLASPAINPVVLASTAVAFPGRPDMVLARFVASLLAAVLVGWVWMALDREQRLVAPRTMGHEHPLGHGRFEVFRDEFVAELVQAASWLVLGAAVAATIKTVVPSGWLRAVQEDLWLQVLALALLAVLVALCSESDAFMAASLTAFSPTAVLTFMVVGPMVDVKLLAMQHGAFGRSFVVRFAPLTLVACLISASLVGVLLL